MQYLYSHWLHRSPGRRSACSLWPAARRSSLHTPSPENFGPGSPRSSCRPHPGLSAPSCTRTEVWAVREDSLSNRARFHLYKPCLTLKWKQRELHWVYLCGPEGYISVWQRKWVFYFPVDCSLSIEVLLIEFWIKQITWKQQLWVDGQTICWSDFNHNGFWKERWWQGNWDFLSWICIWNTANNDFIWTQ